jgi:urease accessory protein UreF
MPLQSGNVSRPAGGGAHSAGLEPSIATGRVRDVTTPGGVLEAKMIRRWQRHHSHSLHITATRGVRVCGDLVDELDQELADRQIQAFSSAIYAVVRSTW